MKRIEVAVGIILNSNNEVLVGQRVVKDAYYLKWEFPGGKLEHEESAESALKRELKEELGIITEDSEELMVLDHDYSDRNVRLFVYIVKAYSGDADGQEGQALQWVALHDLHALDFLKGNRAIIEQLLKRAQLLTKQF